MKKVRLVAGKFLLVVCMLVSIFSVYAGDMKVVSEAAQAEMINHAVGATVTTNKEYAPNGWTGAKLVDGIVNRDAAKAQQSRWSTESAAPAWAAFDLKAKKSIDTIKLAWEIEGQNAQDYHFESSENGSDWTTFYTAPSMSAGHPIDETIKLDSPIETQYVRLVVDKLKPGAFNSVSLYEVELLETIEFDNLSLGATVTVNGREAASVAAENAIDGNTATWWGSNVGMSTKWIALDFKEIKDINSVVLHWERTNAINYDIQTSSNGTDWETIVSFNQKPADYRQMINFDETVTTQYLRVVINTFDPTGAPEGKNPVTWSSVGMIEFETYEETLVIPEPPKATPKDIADDLTLIPIGTNDTTMTMPEVPEGYSISFIGADYEQILAHDLSIIRPLTDRSVVVNFEVIDEETGEKAVSKEYSVLIQGLYDQSASVNAKPTVIPELQEWYGTSGDFAINDGSKIVLSDETFRKAAEEMQKDYEDITGKPIEIVTGTPAAGDFYFVKDTALEEETYKMNVEDYLTVSASTNIGAYWSTRSILQILKQTGTTIPKGTVKDYPKYELRGFMLDVARKPLTLDFVSQISKQMSWYKMNDFQLHLNDNHIQSPSTYIGFRLESDVPNLANTDLVYTKEEFTQFINDSKEIGVNIVPEFDQPGHAAAFTRARPDLARGSEIEYLDVTNPAALEFVKQVISEYVDGDNPVFPEGTVLHVGTDEYKRGNKEAFRKYQDDLLKYVRDEKGITPRLWGSQSENAGTTPITAEGVQMNLWNVGYSNPQQMYDLGYDLINTNDGDLYIVPGAGYYSDYINQTKIATTWQPNKIGSYTLPVGDEQMLGAAFAVWNDMNSNPAPQHTLRDNGFTELEIFDRIFAITPTFASKLWGDIKDYSPEDINNLAETTKYAPNSNPIHEVETKSSTIVDYSFDKDTGTDYSGNAYDLETQKNVSYAEGHDKNALQLNGGESYAETPLTDMGVNKTIDFWIKKDGGNTSEEQILFESALGSIKAVQKGTGQFGYSTDFRDHSFNYTLPDDEWVHITIKTYFSKTELYVNGEKVDELSKGGTGGLSASLIAPFERIGSTTNAFKGQIDDLIITNEIIDDNRIPHSDMSAQVDSAEPGGEARYAIDDNPSTLWHTKWNLSDPLPQSITLTFDKEYTVDKLTYLPRPTGTNGNITQYVVSVSTNGVDYEEVTTGTWANNGELKTAEFDPVDAKYVRLTAITGVGGFASAAEINVYRFSEDIDTSELVALIDKADAMDATLYTPESVTALEFEVRDAKRALDTALTQTEVDAARDNLQAAIDALEKVDTVDTTALEAAIEAAKLIDTSIYTTDSVEALETALAAAEAAMSATTQEEVDKACEDLNKAIEALEEKIDTSALAVAIEKAKLIDTSGYTADSVTAFESALAAAEAAMNATTQEEVDKACADLNEAINNLVKQEEGMTLQTLEDPTGTIKVTGYFDSGVELRVEKYADAKNIIDRILDKKLVNAYDFHDFYAITLWKDGKPYVAKGAVDVEIEVAADIIKKQPSVLYVSDSGEAQHMATEVKDNSVSFSAYHFSDYGIISKKVIEKPSTAPAVDNGEGTDAGDTTNVNLLMALVLLSLVSGGYVWKARRSRK